ncbi:DUF362 domain-containing protein [Thermodesulforhabdus norvegica]|uniref:4Fe-4S ferredoxin-type domain-containing protein n=1 Tax=Thermodesulforhabdus norvegica TaxID=39841 RepID=A0A1I4VYA3_9BACT|nr:DUF362 domain-containing protein [Thermodesulforhabdus norvegica]SFN06017.1 hypothetical protein SAMN05660836_02510 [Thermodesulforhabdus norvegica]
MNYDRVFFTKWRPFSNMLSRFDRLLKKSHVLDVIEPGDLVAVKLHVGELGNPNYIRPFFVKHLIDKIKDKGGKPFLTDTTTYYPEKRSNGYDHHGTAVANGFGYAQFVCADGLKGGYVVPVKTGDELIPEIEVAGALYEADAMIVVTHVKGHPLAGVGGAIKNLGMGGVSKKSKLVQHRLVDMRLEVERCNACGSCAKACRFGFPRIENDHVVIDSPECMHCPICSNACPEGVIIIENRERLCRGLAIATKAVLDTFRPEKVAYLNFAVTLSTICDCGPTQAEILGPDVGIFAGFSALSIDAASFSSIDYRKLNEMHKTDCWEQVRYLASLGVEGSQEPEIKEV